MSFIDTITIGLQTTEKSCPSDSSTAVITLNTHHNLLLFCARLLPMYSIMLSFT